MAWTDGQWSMFTSIISRGFAARDPFTEEDSSVYRLLLDPVAPEAAMLAVKTMVLEGQALRPRPGEIVRRCHQDPGKPTFEEAFLLIFGPRGVLHASPDRRTFADEGDRAGAYRQAALERASTMHPLIGAFVVRQGVDHLRGLPVNDPDYGELRRKELRDSWDRHVEAFAGRDIATLAAGTDRSALGPRRFDPLAALGLDKDQPREIESGEAA